MSVPTVMCAASESAIVVKSQEFLGKDQFPNILAFHDDGTLIFTRKEFQLRWDFAEVNIVRYGPVPLVLNLFTLSVIDGKQRPPTERPTTYLSAACLSDLLRRFGTKLTFEYHL